jgi:type IV pilus assembly protein PilQ
LNKIKSILVGLLLAPSIGAQNITMNVHNVALAEVLYELAEAAQLNLVLNHRLDFDISVVLQDLDARAGLALVCHSVAVDCQYTQQGLVVGEATDQSKTQVLPLHVVKLNYGEADSIMQALQGAQTMLSAKGQLLADNRSQQIFVYDDDAHAASLVEAIKLLDQPLAQILIEGRIVIAKSSLGQSSGLDFIGRLGPKVKAGDMSGGQLGVAFNQLGGGLQLGLVGAHIMLSLELAALEASGQVLTLSQPQILVQEGYSGSIQTGQEVPYIVATDNGQQQEWKRAVLGLTVTPRLLPKNQVQLDLLVVQDSIGDLLPNGQLALNTHKLKTRAVVGLGQTLVLGGALYQQQLDRLLTSPTLSGLPFIGQWFEQQKQDSERFELLVFVTPRIVNP